MFFVYIIRDVQTKGIYIGYTGDLRRRFKEHKHKNPELIYYEAYKHEKDARIRERKLKQRGYGIRRLKERLSYSLI